MRKSRHFLRLSFCQRQSFAVIAGLPLLFCVIDYFNGWRFMGHSGKSWTVLSVIVSLLATLFIGLTESEMKALARKKSAKAMAELSKKLSE
jgi:hypothetical protein